MKGASDRVHERLNREPHFIIGKATRENTREIYVLDVSFVFTEIEDYLRYSKAMLRVGSSQISVALGTTLASRTIDGLPRQALEHL